MAWEKKKTIRTEDYRVFNVHTAEFQHNGNIGTFFQIEAPNWVNVICETRGNIVMIKQYRIGIEDYTLELPAGIVDPGEDALTAGIRELAEETGYAGNAQVIGTMRPNPALFTNVTTTVLVTNAAQNAQISREIFEDIEVVVVPKHTIKQKIAHGEITNALTLASFMQYFNLSSSHSV